jgi:hypothetical protein
VNKRNYFRKAGHTEPEIHDTVLCFNEVVSRKNDVLDILGVRPGPSIVTALKQLNMEKI